MGVPQITLFGRRKMNTEDDHARNRALFRNYPRRMGAILLLISAALIYLCFIDPVIEAQKGAPSVSLSLKGVFLGLVMGVVGLCFLVRGARVAATFYPRPTESKVASYLSTALVLVVSCGAYYLLTLYLNSFSYR
jgi:Ca2+/H+ antiporter